jgi:hypothetical protein
MLIKQISAFIENTHGRLAEVTGYLSEEDINIHALSIADTTDFGILRMIVSDPDKTKEILRRNGLTVKSSDVVAVGISHTPGSLHRVLSRLEKEDINIEYMYAFTSRPQDHDAIVILRLGNQEAALEKIKGSDIKVMDAGFIDAL